MSQPTLSLGCGVSVAGPWRGVILRMEPVQLPQLLCHPPAYATCPTQSADQEACDFRWRDFSRFFCTGHFGVLPRAYTCSPSSATSLWRWIFLVVCGGGRDQELQYMRSSPAQKYFLHRNLVPVPALRKTQCTSPWTIGKVSLPRGQGKILDWSVQTNIPSRTSQRTNSERLVYDTVAFPLLHWKFSTREFTAWKNISRIDTAGIERRVQDRQATRPIIA